MRNYWQLSKAKERGYPTLVHRVTLENTIVGLHGEIFPNNSTTYKVRVWNLKATRIASKLGKQFHPGDEAVFLIKAEDLDRYAKLLKVPELGSTMVSYAMEYFK